MKTRTYVVPVTFQGEVEVIIPTWVPASRRKALASKIAAARILATLDNPDAPEEEACGEYEEECKITEDQANTDWDACQTDSVGGTWEAGEPTVRKRQQAR